MKVSKSFVAFVLFVSLSHTAACAKNLRKPSLVEQSIARVDEIYRKESYYPNIWEFYRKPPINRDSEVYDLLKKLWTLAPNDLPALRQAFQNKKFHNQSRVLAATLLAENGDETSVPMVVEALSEPLIEYNITYALQIYKSPLVTTKLNELVFDKKSRVNPYILVEALARRPEAEALKGLEEVFAQPHRFGGHEAGEAAFGIWAQGKRGIPVLRRLFKKVGYDDYLVAGALAQSPYWEAQKIIVDELEKNMARNLALEYIDAIGFTFHFLSDPKAIPTIEKILSQTKTANIRSAAIAALGNINSAKSFNLLLKAVKDKELYFAKSATLPLRRTGYRKGVGQLLRLCRSKLRSFDDRLFKSLVDAAFDLDKKRVAKAVAFFRKSKDADDVTFAERVEAIIGADRLAGKTPKSVLQKIKAGFASKQADKIKEAREAAVHWRTKETGKLLLAYVAEKMPLSFNGVYGEAFLDLQALVKHGYEPGLQYIKSAMKKMAPFFKMEFALRCRIAPVFSEEGR